jgi:aspartate aminotransferase-like enzyme
LVDEEYRLPQMNAVHVMPGIDEKEVRRRLLEEMNIEIGAGPRPACRENLAIRYHGLQLQNGKCDAVSLCARKRL